MLDEERNPGTVLMFDKVLEERMTMTNAIMPTHCDGLVALATPTL